MSSTDETGYSLSQIRHRAASDVTLSVSNGSDFVGSLDLACGEELAGAASAWGVSPIGNVKDSVWRPTTRELPSGSQKRAISVPVQVVMICYLREAIFRRRISISWLSSLLPRLPKPRIDLPLLADVFRRHVSKGAPDERNPFVAAKFDGRQLAVFKRKLAIRIIASIPWQAPRAQ